VKFLPKNRSVRVVFITTFLASVFFVLYVLFALYVLPDIVKSYLERKAGELIGGEVHVGMVETQPFALALTVRDFSVANKTVKLTWDSLYVNTRLSSIPMRSIRLDELRVHSLNIALEFDEKSSLSQFDSAKEAFLAQANEPFYIEHFIIQSGTLEILDKRNKNEQPIVIKPIKPISLKKFSKQYSPDGDLEFDLNGAFFRWNPSKREMEVRRLDILQFSDFYERHLPFVLQNGTLDLRTVYRLVEEPKLGFELENAKLVLNNPTLLADSSKFAMKASSIQFGTLQFSTLKRTISTDNIILDSVNANYSFIKVPMQPPPELFEFIRHNDWLIKIDSIQTKQASIKLVDSVAAPAVAYNLNVERLLLTDIANHADNPVHVHLLSLLNGSAELDLQGELHLFPLQANGTLNIKDFPLIDLQSYLTQATWLTLRQGLANGTFDMRWDPATDTLLFSGDMEIDSLRLLGRDNNNLVGMQQVGIKGLDAMFAPNPHLQISTANVQAPVMYLTRLANSTANFSQIMKQKSKSGADMPWDIKQINFSRGTIYLTDRNPATPFSQRMTAVHGSMRNSNLSLQGKMGGYAPFSMNGLVKLSGKHPQINLKAESANQDLVDFSPYSGRYAGYRISKGQMALQVDYKVQNNKVHGKNHIIIQHLTFGEKVESPDATNMPVRLGAALLSDKDGVIDLDIAIEGDLDDPEFSVGGLIWKIIKNLLGKAVSAPFKSLMSLVGSNSDPENIVFAPGSGYLGQEQIEVLKNLSQALIQRPQLQVDVRGNADSITDGNVLKEAQLLGTLTRNMPAGSKWTAASVKKPPLRDALFAHYRQVEKKDLNLGDANEDQLVQTSEQVWNELLIKQKLPDNALSNLARTRSQNIKRELINVNATLGDRIFVVDDGNLSQPVANLKIREY